jgi:hypothetical protein
MDIVTVLVTVLSTVVTVSVAVGSVAYWLGSRLTRVEKDIEELRVELRSGLGRLANAINGVGESIIEYLGLKGVLNQGDVNYLKSEIRRIALTAANPFTEAERRRLLELVDKDDLTLEEAEELHRLAWKFYEEYIDKTPDAIKVLFYAAAMRGITYRKYALGKQPNQQPT